MLSVGANVLFDGREAMIACVNGDGTADLILADGGEEDDVPTYLLDTTQHVTASIAAAAGTPDHGKQLSPLKQTAMTDRFDRHSVISLANYQLLRACSEIIGAAVFCSHNHGRRRRRQRREEEEGPSLNNHQLRRRGLIVQVCSGVESDCAWLHSLVMCLCQVAPGGGAPPLAEAAESATTPPTARPPPTRRQRQQQQQQQRQHRRRGDGDGRRPPTHSSAHHHHRPRPANSLPKTHWQSSPFGRSGGLQVLAVLRSEHAHLVERWKSEPPLMALCVNGALDFCLWDGDAECGEECKQPPPQERLEQAVVFLPPSANVGSLPSSRWLSRLSDRCEEGQLAILAVDQRPEVTTRLVQTLRRQALLGGRSSPGSTTTEIDHHAVQYGRRCQLSLIGSREALVHADAAVASLRTVSAEWVAPEAFADLVDAVLRTATTDGDETRSGGGADALAPATGNDGRTAAVGSGKMPSVEYLCTVIRLAGGHVAAFRAVARVLAQCTGYLRHTSPNRRRDLVQLLRQACATHCVTQGIPSALSSDGSAAAEVDEGDGDKTLVVPADRARCGAFFDAAALCWRIDEPHAAMELLARCDEACGNTAASSCLKGRCLIDLGDRGGAAQCFTEALRQLPDCTEARRRGRELHGGKGGGGGGGCGGGGGKGKGRRGRKHKAKPSKGSARTAARSQLPVDAWFDDGESGADDAKLKMCSMLASTSLADRLGPASPQRAKKGACDSRDLPPSSVAAEAPASPGGGGGVIGDGITVLETGVRLSQSLIWSLQRRFYESQGPSAWGIKNNSQTAETTVPFSITSSCVVADAYAEVVYGFASDIAAQLLPLEGDDLGATRAERPPFVVTIIELGAGPAKFSCLFLRRFRELLRRNGPPTSPDGRTIAIRYIITDFAEANVRAWGELAALNEFPMRPGEGPDGDTATAPTTRQEDASWRRHIALDFAIFDATRDASLRLVRTGEVIAPAAVGANAGVNGPVVVIGNYCFDSLPGDAFRVDSGGQLHEALLTCMSPHHQEEGVEGMDPSMLERIRYAWEYRSCDASDYYRDCDDAAPLNAILRHYLATLPDGTTFQLPVEAIRCVRRVHRLVGASGGFVERNDSGGALSHEHDPVLWLIGDKMVARPAAFDRFEDPYIACHGSISLVVNTDAIAEYMRLDNELFCSKMSTTADALRAVTDSDIDDPILMNGGEAARAQTCLHAPHWCSALDAALLVPTRRGWSFERDLKRTAWAFRRDLCGFAPHDLNLLVDALSPSAGGATSLSVPALVGLLSASRLDPDMLQYFHRAMLAALQSEPARDDWEQLQLSVARACGLHLLPHFDHRGRIASRRDELSDALYWLNKRAKRSMQTTTPAVPVGHK